MKILLTGGAGYIGSHVSLELIDNDHQVTIIDNLVNGSKKLLPAKANFLECDIADEKKISNLLKDNKFDVVMHFAGFTRVGESTKFPEKYYENNFEKPKKFFDICIRNNLTKFISLLLPPCILIFNNRFLVLNFFIFFIFFINFLLFNEVFLNLRVFFICLFIY